jgi:hypothetical protein
LMGKERVSSCQRGSSHGRTLPAKCGSRIQRCARREYGCTPDCKGARFEQPRWRSAFQSFSKYCFTSLHLKACEQTQVRFLAFWSNNMSVNLFLCLLAKDSSGWSKRRWKRLPRRV